VDVFLSQVNVRPAAEKDLRRIAEMTRDLTLHHGAFQWSADNHLKHVKRRFSNPRYIHLVAELENQLVGFTGVELKSGKTAYMLKGFVEPAVRRQGIMRRMETTLEQLLKQRGVTKLDLKVNSSNIEGKATWHALGFQTIQETMRKCL
jgi:ribosomal protein S18 acetylase RimI-like enzyme